MLSTSFYSLLGCGSVPYKGGHKGALQPLQR